MPLAEEKLAEKIPFDVYAVMLVLSALLTIGAILMMNAELSENWGSTAAPGTKKAENLTQLNAQTEVEKTANGASPWTQVTEQDKSDYAALAPDAKLSAPAYPDWLKVNTEGTKFIENISEIGRFNMEGVPAEEKATMKSSYVETDATAGVSEEEKKE